MGAPKCMKALYGARAASGTRETRRRNTVKSLISPGERPQEIHTPRNILTAIRAMWPTIALDPCGSPEDIVDADCRYYVSPSVVQVQNKQGKPCLDKAGRPKTKVLYIPGTPGEVDGLSAPWRDYTYCNPPFQLLQDWLDKALCEGCSGKETLMLAPARTHRRWFRDGARTCSSICELDPVTFEGFGQSFPAPLWMLYWGTLTNLFEFEFNALGGVR
jgi:hypothetical protein